MEDYWEAATTEGSEEEECLEEIDFEESLDTDAAHASNSTSEVKVITEASLVAAQKEDLYKVMEVLGIKEHHARTLLIHHRWDCERLLGLYVEKGKDRLFSEAGVTLTTSSMSLTALPSKIMCLVCMDEKAKDDFTVMDCGHYYCNECWTEYFVIKIQEGQSRRLVCIEQKCNAICDEDIVRNLVRQKSPEVADRFERFLLESYIEDNSKVKWCPSIPNCGSAIRVDGEPICEVECLCGKQFCFNCLSEAHSPCSCLMWDLWDKKCKDESETVNWLTVHTKNCPKCGKPVEKNGGCNLVSCICGQCFCWLCGGATGREHTWTSIEGHSCGRYKEDREKESAKAERDLKRYIHYHSRWKAHMDSLKLESKQRESLNTTIAELERKDSGVTDYSWLTNGLDKLFRARRALAYSYPFAYYMFGDDLFHDEMSVDERLTRQHLFEDQQQQLERTVENLSKFIEVPVDEQNQNNIMEVRMQVINLTVVADAWCSKMYDCIENDLLGSLVTAHHIAPYNSKGVEKASELIDKKENEPSSSCRNTEIGFEEHPGGSTKHVPGHTVSKRETQTSCSKRKRSREDNGGIAFDLNMPAAEINDALGTLQGL